MDIEKYINNTKEKTKKAKLPVLSKLTPIIPDAGAGISSFNAHSGADMSSVEMSEDLSVKDIDKVKSNIESQSKAFMIDKGFDEDELDKVLNFDFIEKENVFTIKVKADLTISSLRELADTLYDVVSEYDEDAYFDIATNNMISVDLEMKDNLSENINDPMLAGMKTCYSKYNNNAMYESVKTKLDANDRAKLQKFLQTTDDPEEVNVYMKGLLMEDTEEEITVDDYNSYDDFDNVDVDTSLLDDIDENISNLKALLNELTAQANKTGNDVLRSNADMSLGALDDLASYVRDINIEINDVWEEEE